MGKKGVCTYCGAHGRVQSDHVPPKLLFASPRPKLVTVPACPRCHRGTSKDDEYLRMVLSMRHDTHEHPDAADTFNRMLRGLRRPEQRGFRESVTRNMYEVRRRSASGIFLGSGVGYKVDEKRIQGPLGRIVRGFFLRETGRRLPVGAVVNVWTLESQLEKDASGLALIEPLLRALLAEEERTLGVSTFSYRVHFLPDGPWQSLWLLTFYGAAYFLGITTGPAGDRGEGQG